MRSRWLFALTLVPLLLGIACGASDSPPAGTEGGSIGDRYLRLFEVRDFGSSLFVYDAALPPNLAELLNPGLTDETPQDDIIAIPIPLEGELLGSYHIRRLDGTSEIWLAYDVPGADPEVELQLRELMDETPWQVTGGQSNELFGAVSFQSTVSGDIEGFVAVQALPSTPTFAVTVERDGQQLELELARGAFIPQIDARYRELTSRLEVTEAPSGAQVQKGDVLVAVGETAVTSERDLLAALRALGEGGEPRTAVLYRLTILAPVPASEPVFLMPLERPLPDGFPAEFLVVDDLSVVEVTWDNQTGGDLYQVTMVTERSAFDVAEDYRVALASAGWELVSDEAQGFGTVLNFSDDPNGVVGVANIDQFPSDESLNSVILQVQVGRGTN